MKIPSRRETGTAGGRVVDVALFPTQLCEEIYEFEAQLLEVVEIAIVAHGLVAREGEMPVLAAGGREDGDLVVVRLRNGVETFLPLSRPGLVTDPVDDPMGRPERSPMGSRDGDEAALAEGREQIWRGLALPETLHKGDALGFEKAEESWRVNLHHAHRTLGPRVQRNVQSSLLAGLIAQRFIRVNARNEALTKRCFSRTFVLASTDSRSK